jgi:putative transposase
MQALGMKTDITVTADDCARLASLISGRNTPAKVVWRARIVLATADGESAKSICRSTGMSKPCVWRWQRRFAEDGVDGLVRDKTRPPGRKPLSVETKARVLAKAARETPPDATHWSVRTMAKAMGISRTSVQRIWAIRKAAKTRKWSAKRRFAERLPKHLKAHEPGQIVQLDTVYVTLAPGKHVKHCTGYDPVAKWTVAQAFERATATSAALFLDKLQAEMPFPVRGIQVDGGSEFMAEFEAECARRDLELYVLPPRMPELNGAVERCNGAWRYEFYACTDLHGSVEELNPLIDVWADTYNFVRPLLPRDNQGENSASIRMRTCRGWRVEGKA